MSTTQEYLKMTVDLARQNAERGGRPFASIIVKDGKVVASAVNTVEATGDPTAHAETEAIRAAAKALKSEQLDGCVLYASGHPCPMCLAAMYVSGIKEGYYAYSMEDAPGGLSRGAMMYAEFRKPIPEQSIRLVHHPLPSDGDTVYAIWERVIGLKRSANSAGS